MSDGREFVEGLMTRRVDRFAAVRTEGGTDGSVVPETLGWQMQVIVRATRAYYILEVGGGAGYTGLHMLSAVWPTGRLDLIEPDPALARAAEGNFIRFGFSERFRVHNSSASAVITGLSGPYDLVVVHGPPARVADDFEELLRLTRIGGSMFFSDLSAAAAEQTDGRGGPESAFLERIAGDARLATWIDQGLSQALAARSR